MPLLLWLAGFIAFCIISLRVPVEARDFGYYVNGLIVIVALSLPLRRWRE